MAVRKANKFDVPSILELGHNAGLYRANCDIDLYKVDGEVVSFMNTDSSDSWKDTPRKILTHILAGAGIAYVYEKDKKVVGLIVAIKVPLLWDFNKYLMQEILYWIEPEYRGGSAAYRLLQAYVNECDSLKDNKQIMNYTMSIDANRKLNLAKLGFKKTEQVWIQ